MDKGHFSEHPSVERIQAFLEGELPHAGQDAVEAHLGSCARCAAELDAWRVLFEDLDDLALHSPREGFAERVMAGVLVPGATPHGARVPALPLGVTGAGHLDDGVLQDFLDGGLGARRAARVATHLADCPLCEDRAAAWRDVFHGLDAVERLTPSPALAARVLAGIGSRQELPLAARVRARLAAFLPAGSSRHLKTERLQDFVDGVLSPRQAARVHTHVAACAPCSGEVQVWRTLHARLGALPRFAPPDGFAERVAHGVRLATPHPAPARAPAWVSVLDAARRLVPHERKAWAALSGVAVTPAVVVGLVAYAVFSHPTLTASGLASWAWWQVIDVASAAWTSVAASAVASAEVFGLYSLVNSLASAPLVVAAGVLAYTLGCAFALRVLYRNLIAHRSVDGRYAHAQAS